MANFIHYIPRKVYLRYPTNSRDLWYSQDQSPFDGLVQPRFHTTRAASGPATQIKAGDTIWLVSQVHSKWGRLPPSLDARYDVQSVSSEPLGRIQKLTFKAAPTSRWFPLADVSAVLSRLRTETRGQDSGPLVKNENQPIGFYLQSIRRLSDAQPIRDWQNSLDQLGYDFVSYRLKDGTKEAWDAIQWLVDQKNRPIFWDRWSLPRRYAEWRERIGPRPLDKIIVSSIENASCVWGIETELYAEDGSYSKLERDNALKKGIYRTFRYGSP